MIGTVSPDGKGNLARSLSSLVATVKDTFEAQACSVSLYDEQAGALRFQAISGAGEESIVGQLLPNEAGLAQWAFASGEACAVDDLEIDPNFNREFAQSTGYVPASIVTAPIFVSGEAVGVMQVLDRGGQFANADDALGLLQRFTDLAGAILTGQDANAPEDGTGGSVGGQFSLRAVRETGALLASARIESVGEARRLLLNTLLDLA